jgi:predicted component of type VI protein secretion system
MRMRLGFALETQIEFRYSRGRLPLGLRLRITNTISNTSVDRAFAQLPVRIGRNTLNDLPIVDRFVSQFHAVLELGPDGKALMLRDLGSSNGTKVGSNRAPPHQPIELAPYDEKFSVGPLVFEAEVTTIESVMPRRTGNLGAAAAMIAAQEKALAEDDEANVLEDSVVTNVATLMFDAGAAVADARKKLSGGTANLGGTLMLDPAQNVAARNAALAQAQAASRDATVEGKQRKLEQLALQGVREMARTLVPSLGPIDEPEDLVRFLSKVRDTVEVFLRTFIPLRAGYHQFATQMDLQRRAQGMSEPPAFGVKRIETAQNERELAECLLDWKVEGGDSHKAVERTFADLMIHQLALLHAIMRGVKSLLHELSPTTIDGAFEEESKQGKSGFSWGPWRFKELWRIYGKKYGDMDDGDKRTFAALFGPDFAEAYKQYRGTVDAPPEP